MTAEAKPASNIAWFSPAPLSKWRLQAKTLIQPECWLGLMLGDFASIGGQIRIAAFYPTLDIRQEGG